jgi:hypothetical protein
VPVVLAKIIPLDIKAISLGIFVFCKDYMDERVKRHETIHFFQQLELLIVLHWVLYLLFWTVGVIKYGDGETAYYQNPLEQEAFENDSDELYIQKRAPYAWLKYVKHL